MATNPKSLKNLKPFKPGKSGNENGRPKGSVSLVSLLKEKLAEIPEGSDKKTYAELLIQRMMSIALKNGDVSMIKDILNRVDGLPHASVDLTSKGEAITGISAVLTEIENGSGGSKTDE